MSSEASSSSADKSPIVPIEPAEEVTKDDEKHMTSGDYYWNSYAHFGIHEVGLFSCCLIT